MKINSFDIISFVEDEKQISESTTFDTLPEIIRG